MRRAIDDCAIAPITAAERNDMLELLDAPTLADAILDRIVHAAHKIARRGESMCRK